MDDRLVAARAGAVILFCLFALAATAAAKTRLAVSPGICRSSTMLLTFGPRVSEPTQQLTLALRLRNRGATCVLDGYPAIRFYDHSGLIPFAIRNGGDQVVTSRPPRRLLVKPGGVVFVVLNHSSCVVGDQRTADVLAVSLTNSVSSRRLVIDIPRDLQSRAGYCGQGNPGSTIVVSPFEPTYRSAIA